MNQIIQGDALKVIRELGEIDCIFADPPDNIGSKYNDFKDNLATDDYTDWLGRCLKTFVLRARVVWLSYNARWNWYVGEMVQKLTRRYNWLEPKLCVQVFTFGQHNQQDLGNCFRPLLRLKRKTAPLYPDVVRVTSWRQKHGDKRADPRGKVPGDVFDFPRVTGNSRQRRRWHPTQLHEGLVERCVLLSTLEGEHVVDPFAGTGTTLRVCKHIKRRCTLIESDRSYCEKIAKEHKLRVTRA